MAKPAVSSRSNYTAPGTTGGSNMNIPNANSNSSSGTNTNNTTPLARSNPAQFNRQDLIGTLLNNYTYPSFGMGQFQGQQGQAQGQGQGQVPQQVQGQPQPQGQMPPQGQGQIPQQGVQAQGQGVQGQSQGQVPGQGQFYYKEDVRPRGDSIYLPPPVTSQFRFSGSEDPAGSGQLPLPPQQQVPTSPPGQTPFSTP